MAWGNHRAPPAPVARDGICQGLQQHDVVVHRIDPFFGVGGQIQHAGQLAVRQLNHDGQRALPVQRRADRNQGGVGEFSIQLPHPSHAQRSLHRQPVFLLDLMHGDGERAHLVFTHVVETEMERKTPRRRFENQLGDAGVV